MNLNSLLQSLTAPAGVSGNESLAAKAAVIELKKYCDSVEINDRGSVVGKINGTGPKILLDAHLDQIGFIVTDISDNGFIKFDKCGSSDERVLSGLEVTILGREEVYGVISSVPPHLADSAFEGKAPKASELAIDTGLNKEDVERLITRGDRVVPRFKFLHLLGTELSSAAFDDRSGMAVHIRALDLIRQASKKNFQTPNVIVTFSVLEENGGRGASTAAFNEEVDVAIAVDVSFAYTPGCEREECGIIGKGPMIGISPVLSSGLSKELIDIAEKMDIPNQREIMAGRTSTHADELSICKTGIKTGLVSIPLKYMHTPCEVIDTKDIENSAALIAQFCINIANEGCSNNVVCELMHFEDSPLQMEPNKAACAEMSNLQSITDIYGVSGREELVRNYIVSRLPKDVKYYSDNIGNLIVEKKGKKTPDSKLLVLSHMDEVGLIITYITDEGYLKFNSLGGVCEQILIGRTVTLESGVSGVIALKHIHQCSAEEHNAIPSIEKLCIDIGAHSKEEAEKFVTLGSYAVFNSNFVEFGSDLGRIKAKALDDRLGCELMLELINLDLDYDTTFAFTVQEEVGARGAGVATFAVNPDKAIIIETTTAGDICGVAAEKRACVLGNGPVVSYMDRGTVYDIGLYRTAMSLAKDNNIPAQTKTLIAGGNDSSAVQRTGSGVRVLAVSLPCRYLHSPSCVIDKTDIENTRKLLRLLINNI